MIIKENPLSTRLVNETISKLDSRETFFGVCDELSSWLMSLRCDIDKKETRLELKTIVSNLSTIMGEVAGGKGKLEEKDLEYMYSLMAKYEIDGGKITHFILPGQNKLSAKIHIVRTIARRCELAYAKVYAESHGNNLSFQYLNKLSTFLYDLALRYETEDIDE